MSDSITIGVEQEVVGCEIVSKKSKKKYQKYFACICDTYEREKEPLPLVWITGDTITGDENNLIYQTLELSTHPVEIDSSNQKQVTKYVLNQFIGQLKNMTQTISIADISIPPLTISITDPQVMNMKYEFFIRDYSLEETRP